MFQDANFALGDIDLIAEKGRLRRIAASLGTGADQLTHRRGEGRPTEAAPASYWTGQCLYFHSALSWTISLVPT